MWFGHKLFCRSKAFCLEEILWIVWSFSWDSRTISSLLLSLPPSLLPSVPFFVIFKNNLILHAVPSSLPPILPPHLPFLHPAHIHSSQRVSGLPCGENKVCHITCAKTKDLAVSRLSTVSFYSSKEPLYALGINTGFTASGPQSAQATQL